MKTKMGLVLALGLVFFSTACVSTKEDTHATKEESSKHEVDEHAENEKEGEEHRVEVHLSSEKLARLDVRTEKAKKGIFPQIVEAVGKVGFNERRRVDLVARTAGRVEKAHVFSGDRVKQGTLLVEIYSPDYLSAQTDFIQAATRVNQETQGKASVAVKALMKASWEKLALFGESHAEIQELLKKKTPNRFLHIHAPFDGTVVTSKSVVGRSVNEGDLLLSFADLSTVWVTVDLYEKDLSRVAPKSQLTIIPDAYPDQQFQATITMIGAKVEEETRTVEARAEMKNPKGVLKPGMFVRAKMESKALEGKEGLLIPTHALVKNDQTEGVFISEGKGEFRFQPVLIRQRSSVWAEIQSGLSGDEEVVTKGTFFLKSELSKGELGEGHGH